MAHVIEVTEHAMRADERCDRCSAQAYVEVAMTGGGTLLFCAHHATNNWPKLLTMDGLIADHRPFLNKAEAPAPA